MVVYLKRITLKSKISGNYTQFFKTLEMQSQTTSFHPHPRYLRLRQKILAASLKLSMTRKL